MEQKDKEVIKEAYRELLEIEKVNSPDYYIMPKSVYNSIMKKIIYLETTLQRITKQRDNWKQRWEDLRK